MLVTDPAAAALDDAAFARRMVPLGPFEAAPRIAVGVSGGADSLALALLLDRWCRARGGAVLALTVDHRLRPESTAEAEQVGRWLRARAIAWAMLSWEGEKPAAGIQAAARAARHGLLRARCRDAGILTLALAHHRDDQAETFLLRHAARSGPDGLAAMPAVRETADLRLIRPLLDLPKARLEATLRALGQDWVDDPSNRSPRFARGRLRAGGGVADAAALAADARQAGLERAARDRAMAVALACHASFYPEGWVDLDGDALAGSDPGLAERLLSILITVVGGRTYAPRQERLARLSRDLRDGRCTGASLGGCLIRPLRGGWRFCREARDLGADVPIFRGKPVVWDNRFRLCWDGEGPARVAALGDGGWTQVKAAAPALARLPLPAAVRRTLPAVWRGGTVLTVPHLNYVCAGPDAIRCTVIPAMPEPACRPCFSVVRPVGDII